MSTSAAKQTPRIWRLARKAADIVAECHYASRRMTELFTAPDRYMFDPGTAPDTYADFLYRTSGLLRREPSARDRAAHARR